jgi:hypothetical protein
VEIRDTLFSAASVERRSSPQPTRPDPHSAVICFSVRRAAENFSCRKRGNEAECPRRRTSVWIRCPGPAQPTSPSAVPSSSVRLTKNLPCKKPGPHPTRKSSHRPPRKPQARVLLVHLAWRPRIGNPHQRAPTSGFQMLRTPRNMPHALCPGGGRPACSDRRRVFPKRGVGAAVAATLRGASRAVGENRPQPARLVIPFLARKREGICVMSFCFWPQKAPC